MKIISEYRQKKVEHRLFNFFVDKGKHLKVINDIKILNLLNIFLLFKDFIYSYIFEVELNKVNQLIL